MRSSVYLSWQVARVLAVCPWGPAVAVVAWGAVAAAGSAQPDGWQLVWADEFDGATVNSGHWRIADKPGDTNNELQYYAPDEVYIEGGELVLRSRERSHGGRRYTSGLVLSRHLFAQMYGRVEVRARLPGTRGTWPAHWMLPQAGQWPPEIDIMELKGQQPRTVYMTHHWGQWPNVQSQGGTYTGPDFTTGYHVFALEWSPGEIRWYVDDELRFESRNQHVPAEPMYLILNTAVGGHFVGDPDGSTVFPQHHRIDYVRVYTRSDAGEGQALIQDTTVGGAACDGVIGAGEYVGEVGGINDGFGDRLGRASTLALDSDRHGRLYVGVDSATAWPDGTSDGVVLYLDTAPGGMTSTISMIDNTNRMRALVSGRARLGGEQVNLFFPDGFAAEYAIVLQEDLATLVALDPWFHGEVAAAEVNAGTDTQGGDALLYARGDGDATMREVSLRLADIGARFGGTVRLLGTQLNADTGERSNEYAGVATGHWFDAVPATMEDVQLGAGDFLGFVVTAEFCPGDSNEDGLVDTRDVLQFLGWWTAGDERADLVEDGVINTLDVIAFLALWNGECD